MPDVIMTAWNASWYEWWTTILIILGGYVGFMIFVGIKAHHEWKRKFKKK